MIFSKITFALLLTREAFGARRRLPSRDERRRERDVMNHAERVTAFKAPESKWMAREYHNHADRPRNVKPKAFHGPRGERDRTGHHGYPGQNNKPSRSHNVAKTSSRTLRPPARQTGGRKLPVSTEIRASAPPTEEPFTIPVEYEHSLFGTFAEGSPVDILRSSGSWQAAVVHDLNPEDDDGNKLGPGWVRVRFEISGGCGNKDVYPVDDIDEYVRFPKPSVPRTWTFNKGRVRYNQAEEQLTFSDSKRNLTISLREYEEIRELLSRYPFLDLMIHELNTDFPKEFTSFLKRM